MRRRKGALCGIYALANQVSGKLYVGRSVDIYDRVERHWFALKRKEHRNNKLQRSYDHYGLEAFTVIIIELCDESVVIEREQYWLDELDAVNSGYNLQPSAVGPLGVKRSEESKKNYSRSSTGRKASDEARAKMSLAKKGKPLPAWHREKLSLARRKGPMTEEDRARIYATRRGKPKSKQHRERIAQGLAKFFGAQKEG